MSHCLAVSTGRAGGGGGGHKFSGIGSLTGVKAIYKTTGSSVAWDEKCMEESVNSASTDTEEMASIPDNHLYQN